MVTMLIADDELSTIKQLFNNIMNNSNNIQLVGIKGNGIEVLKFLKKTVPDILLLDLIMPEMNGIEVLDKIIQDEEKYFPKLHIIIISSYIEKIYNSHKYINYVYDKITKPCDILKLKNIIERICNDIEYDKIIRYVNQELYIFEFNVKSNGYRYLKEAIYEILYRKDRNFELENDIYIKIANMYNKKNPQIIKWSIEKLIEKMYRDTRYDIIQKYFGFEKDKKPSIKLLIKTILDKYIDTNYDEIV